MGRLGKTLREFGAAPQRQVIDGKFRGIRRLSHVHIRPVMLKVINPVWHRSPVRFAGEIMAVHNFGALTPYRPNVFEVTDQFFFLRIDAQNRMTRLLMRLALGLNVSKLRVAFWRTGPFCVFAVHPQSVVMPFEQSTDDGQTHFVAHLG